MDNTDTRSADLNSCIDALAEGSTLTRGQIIEDAVAHGRSLARQGRWIAGVHAGIDDADRGEFASEEEIAAVLTKYGPA